MWHDILMIVIGIIAGGILGFFLSKKKKKKYLTKNPPINEDMIKALMSGMGRTPNQKQINQMMKQMQNVNKKK